MSKRSTKFICQECGFESLKWMGKCAGCQSWNSIVEERITIAPHLAVASQSASIWSDPKAPTAQARPINLIEKINHSRIDIGMKELNRVLGGGLVPGSLILVGGDPGIGKSTLLLQAAHLLSAAQNTVLYASGEESQEQIRIRADRLGAISDKLLVACETDLLAIERLLRDTSPSMLVIDSIQTMFHPAVTSAPGSVSQVRECTSFLMKIAKERRIAIIIVGHVTKTGVIAGPRMLEHMVDCVLYFEGERHHTYRVLRAVKNRFGSTNEIGVYEMKAAGLVEVENPSEIFLAGRAEGAAGTAVTASMEGSRPILLELQALVAPTNFVTPKRMSTGFDHNRLTMIIAVLEKKIGFVLHNQDVFFNVVGGVRIDEPAADLAVALSLASSFRDSAVNSSYLLVGEVGLTGEVRGVSRIEQRVLEGYNLGFKHAIVPSKNIRGLQIPEDMKVIGIDNVRDALQVALGG